MISDSMNSSKVVGERSGYFSAIDLGATKKHFTAIIILNCANL